MKKNLLFLLFTIFTFFQTNSVFAQADCSNDPPPERYVCETVPICGFAKLDAYCLRMVNPGVSYGFPNNPPGCELHAPNWFAFVAGEDLVELRFIVHNCQGCINGIQLVIYEGDPDCSGTPPTGLTEVGGTHCQDQYQPSPPGAGSYNIQFPTQPCHTYYVVFDPFSGCYCDVDVDVLQGVGVPQTPEITDHTEVNFPEFNGPDTICTGATDVNLCAEIDAGCAAYYLFEFPNGDVYKTTVGELCAVIEDGFPTPGTYEICVASANDCDTADFVCQDYIVADPRPVSVEDAICEGYPPT